MNNHQSSSSWQNPQTMERRCSVSSQKNEDWREDATPLPIFWLTLYFRVEKHVQKCPLESGGGSLGTSCKQVCGHQTKVVIAETILFSHLTLWRANKWVVGAGVLAEWEDHCFREVLRSTRSIFADQEVHWESRAQHRQRYVYGWCTSVTLLPLYLKVISHLPYPERWWLHLPWGQKWMPCALKQTAGPCHLP